MTESYEHVWREAAQHNHVTGRCTPTCELYQVEFSRTRAALWTLLACVSVLGLLALAVIG